MSRKAIKHAIRKLLQAVGYDLVRYDIASDGRARRAQLMAALGIDCVLDVGANRGGYGVILRETGYLGTIHSFEPLTSAFHDLMVRTSTDSEWSGHPFALGEEEAELVLNEAANSYSSSFLEMGDAHRALAPSSGYLGKSKVQVRRLDTVWDALVPSEARCLLKVDTQGFEKAVLVGAGSRLDQCPLVELELSFVELYQGQPLFDEVHDWMRSRGYRPVSFETTYGQVVPETGETQQVDLIYARSADP